MIPKKKKPAPDVVEETPLVEEIEEKPLVDELEGEELEPHEIEAHDPAPAAPTKAPAFALPNLLYKSPGPHPGGGSDTFDYVHVDTPERLQKMLDKGWFTSKEAVTEAYAAEKAATLARK